MKSKKVFTAYIFLISFFIIILSQTAHSETVLSLDLTIYKNDTAYLNNIKLLEGRATPYISSGDYSLKITDNSENILFEHAINLVFALLSDPPIERDYADLSLRIPFNNNMKKIILEKNGTDIFSSLINLCNNNNFCDPNEDYLSCPSDCPLDKKDGICIKDADGICDPDCLPGVDPDCSQTVNQTITPNASASGCGNGICDSTETYLSCPQDCPSGGKDGYCDGVKDGICDPDCQKNQDPDCAAAPARAETDDTARILIAAIFGVILLFIALFVMIKMKARSEQ